MGEPMIPKDVQALLLAELPALPDLLPDPAEWAEFMEANRLRRVRISMDTGIPVQGIG